MRLIPALVISAATFEVAAPPEVALGVAAYDRGDFAAARAILKPIVYDAHAPADDLTLPYAWAAAYLAQMYRRGEGTEPDWALSCALFNDVWAFTYPHGPDGPQIPFVDDGIKEVCVPRLQEEVTALRSACFLDGVTRHEFILEGGGRVVLDRRGFHLDLGGERQDVLVTMWCHQSMVSLTLSEVSILDGSSKRRVHFLEMFKWANGVNARDGHIVRELHWIVYAVRDVVLAIATEQIVLRTTDGPYPSTEMPPGVREATILRANAAGDVEWIVRGQPGKRGVISTR